MSLSAVIMMAVILTLVWGGFIGFLVFFIKKNRNRCD